MDHNMALVKTKLWIDYIGVVQHLSSILVKILTEFSNRWNILQQKDKDSNQLLKLLLDTDMEYQLKSIKKAK